MFNLHIYNLSAVVRHMRRNSSSEGRQRRRRPEEGLLPAVQEGESGSNSEREETGKP